MELELTTNAGQTIITFPDKVELKDSKLLVYHNKKVDEYHLNDLTNVIFTDNI